ncbi:MAG: hypothetical protein H6738_24500 [Alphaproteobacteria bacterium]|nr:hypothetical protein [Alphaproteobacteria bacterium]MCB9699971.1 hypothetical protein [Alphaproteobacteria bacterium]
MAARTTKPKRFRLSFVGPIEDHPRLIRAYGRACEGEFALVMRPNEARAVLVLITKSDGAFMWRSQDDGQHERVKATVLRDGPTRLRIESGRHAGAVVTPEPEIPTSAHHGEVVEVVLSADGQVAELRPGAGDCLQRPDTPISAADAVKLVKVEQKAVPKAGPTTLRGRWSGTLTCDAGQPRLELKRKLATYGTLWVRSDPATGWSWTFDRSEEWFTGEEESSNTGYATLAEAIQGGVLGAMSLVREACSFRDTRRRAAHDPTYAEKHPIKPPKPMADPTARLGTRKRGRARSAAPPPKPIDDGTPTPDVPETPAALGRMAEEATREGDALAELTGRRWIWEETTPPSDIAHWFDDNGFQGLGESITDYAATTTYPVGEFIRALKKDLRDCETVHDDDPDPKVYAEAQRQIELLQASLTSTPAMMERARKLIRYASSMVKSPKCKGRDQKEAVEAVQRATEAYEEARTAILEGRSWDALKTLRRIGERVALSAAKAAKSCGSGQTSLTARTPKPVTTSQAAEQPSGLDRMPKKKTESAYGYARRLLSEASSRVGEGHHNVVRELLAEAGKQAATLSSSKATRIYDRIKYIEGKLTAALTTDGWEPFALGDRVVFNELPGQVSRVPSVAYAPTDRVTFLADGRKRGRRVEARLLTRESSVVTDDRTVDADKDKVLIDAFSAAITAALQAA